MKNLLSGLLISFLTFCSVARAQAVPSDVRIEKFSYSGDGCPAGTVKYTITPDSSIVSFLFDRYIVQATNSKGQLGCRVQFLIKYPRNFRLSIVGVTYMGGIILPEGAQASISTKITQTISKFTRTIEDSTQNASGPLNESFTIDRTTTQGDVFSCGGVAGLVYLFDSKIAVNNPTSEAALLQIDSADIDVRGGFSFKLAWQPCN